MQQQPYTPLPPYDQERNPYIPPAGANPYNYNPVQQQQQPYNPYAIPNQNGGYGQQAQVPTSYVQQVPTNVIVVKSSEHNPQVHSLPVYHSVHVCPSCQTVVASGRP
ncbi:hypothetical protein FGO68_gene1870 [Halteria grandinella]|uniref:Uncharacterized protein n=1 Tax=Halteria grandinella TaxID=5974 RepID=A0A8J8SYD5_HALGN|nr:hypothetical protein FGO68_gene1870 [Halteria grandinella]